MKGTGRQSADAATSRRARRGTAHAASKRSAAKPARERPVEEPPAAPSAPSGLSGTGTDGAIGEAVMMPRPSPAVWSIATKLARISASGSSVMVDPCELPDDGPRPFVKAAIDWACPSKMAIEERPCSGGAGTGGCIEAPGPPGPSGFDGPPPDPTGKT